MGDSVARGPKFFLKKELSQKIFGHLEHLSIDYEQVLFCIVSGTCI
jgi:hypothetical protein